MTELLRRSLTVFLLFTLLSFLYVYGNNFIFISLIYIVSILSFYEWNTINHNRYVYFFLFVFMLTFLDYTHAINIYYLALVNLLGWIILIYLMIFNREKLQLFIKKYFIVIGLFILLPFSLLLTNMYPYSNTLTSNSNLVDNKHYFLFLILLISSIDIFAYISGKLFGRNKIISDISPNKTLEGYIGSYLFTFVFFIIFFNVNQIFWTYLDLVYLSIIVLAAFFGDLFMSFVKRTYDIKDTGSILPGHGGILDRLDSYFPSLPIFYLWLMI